MSAEHAELVGEMAALEKMSHGDRVRHARKRRNQQLKANQNYEKQLEKKQNKMSKKENLRKTNKNRTIKLKFDNTTLLFDAVARNDIPEATMLLDNGMDPNTSNADGLTVLHQCCLNDYLEMLKLFLNRGADVNKKDVDSWTPLHLAATYGYTEICRLLCQKDVNLLAMNSDGNMPYDLCEQAETLDLIESEMAKSGISQELIDNVRLEDEYKILEHIKDNKTIDYNSKGQYGETLLHVAASNGYCMVAKYLIDKDADVNAIDNEGWTPLHCAICFSQLLVIEELLKGGAKFNIKTNKEEDALDLCESFEMRQRINSLIQEVQVRPSSSTTLKATVQRENSSMRRGSNIGLHNTARRGSLHNKQDISHREAMAEAALLNGLVSSDNMDDDDNLSPLNLEKDVIILPSITVPVLTSEIINKPILVSSTSNKNKPKSEAPLAQQIWISDDESPKAQEHDEKSIPTNQIHKPDINNRETIINIDKRKSTDSNKILKSKDKNENQFSQNASLNEVVKQTNFLELNNTEKSKVHMNSLDSTNDGVPKPPKTTAQLDQSISSNLSVEKINTSVTTPSNLTDNELCKSDSKSLKLSEDYVDNNLLSNIGAHGDTHEQAANGIVTSKGKTLADLKKERANKMKEAGLSTNSGKNGKFENGDTVPRMISISDPPRKYVNQNEVVYGEKKCCLLM